MTTTYFWKLEVSSDDFLITVRECTPNGEHCWRYAIPAVGTDLPAFIDKVVQRHPAVTDALQAALKDFVSTNEIRHISGDFFVKDEP